MKKRTKTMLSMLIALTMLFSILPAANVFASSKSYKACMAVQTNTSAWIFRNAYEDQSFGHSTSYYKNLYSINTKKRYAGKFHDTTIRRNGTYTVSLTGANFSKEKKLSLLFVSTTIPKSKKVKFTNVRVKMNGVTKHVFKTGVIDPKGDYKHLLCINIWNSKVAKFKYSMPKSISITFKVSGL